MNINNKRIIALLLTIVFVISILNVEYNNLYDNVKKRENRINEYYISQELLNLLEQKTKNENNNLLEYKFHNKIISNYFNKYIVGNIYSITNIYKLKYTAVINDMFSIYNDSVFVVIFMHKADGKKRL